MFVFIEHFCGCQYWCCCIVAIILFKSILGGRLLLSYYYILALSAKHMCPDFVVVFLQFFPTIIYLCLFFIDFIEISLLLFSCCGYFVVPFFWKSGGCLFLPYWRICTLICAFMLGYKFFWPLSLGNRCYVFIGVLKWTKVWG